MSDNEVPKSNYPGCPPGWEPPVAPVFKYSTATTCVNAFAIEDIMPDITAYIGARFIPGEVFKEVKGFLFPEAGAPPVVRRKDIVIEPDEAEGNYFWKLKGRKGNFYIHMDRQEGYFFCGITVLREDYFEAKALLEQLLARVNSK